ncbi:hypothetical protein NDU88_003865 [Pleurodeles waltl]|uniref:Uncharacterized protein n=1 Tax=Pleurodeles waltl TaxID=8319 RepID=A0AAV7KZR1_PLEWA|nr:hypothetical protein NDU88_003865 [Pleurodeles waltl]
MPRRSTPASSHFNGGSLAHFSYRVFPLQAGSGVHLSLCSAVSLCGRLSTPQHFFRCCSLSLDRAQWPHSGVNGVPGRSAAFLVSHFGRTISPILLSGPLSKQNLWGPAPLRGTSYVAPARARGPRAQFCSPEPRSGPVRLAPVRPGGLGPCPLPCLQLGFVLWSGAPLRPPPRRVPRGSLPQLLGPGASAATRGPPAPTPGRPAASRKAAVSQGGMGRKPPLVSGGPPLSRTHLRPTSKDRSHRQPVSSLLLVLR